MMPDLTVDQSAPSSSADTLTWRRNQGRVSQRTLILIRWVGIAGQLLTVGVVHWALEYALPLAPILAVIAITAAVNTAAMLQRQSPSRLSDRDATLYLAYDIIQLAVLLYLTGGLLNPFAVLLLAPLLIGATVLRRVAVIALTVLTLACTAILALWHEPLPGDLWEGGSGLYRLGLWVALSLSAVVLTAYIWQVADEAQQMDAALSASQLALSREQRISALGGLAAAAAHELGTPLATISLVAKELGREIPDDDPLAEDVRLLIQESQRCRRILGDLGRAPEGISQTAVTRQPLTAIADQAALPHRIPGIDLIFTSGPDETSPEPRVVAGPALVHGLGNLLQNAIQFADSRVSVNVRWNRMTARLVISDDGPGYPPALLGRLGEPYLSVRDRDHEGMGLGIFIATTLLRRTGASVSFANSRSGGAQVAIHWDRDHLDQIGRDL